MAMKYDSDFRDALVSTVEEAMVAYARQLSVADPVTLSTLSAATFFDDRRLLSLMIRAGMPYRLFAEIRSMLPFTEADWAHYLNVSTKTLQRHSTAKDFTFKPIHTEKILEMAELALMGAQVFDSMEQFYMWLDTPTYALGESVPRDLIGDSYGRELVMDELHRIEHGIFA